MSGWTPSDVLHLLAAKPGGDALLPGVTSRQDLATLAEMARQGLLTFQDFGIVHATITPRGREVLADAMLFVPVAPTPRLVWARASGLLRAEP